MNRTKVDWADYSWSPVTGCTRGCSYCYARRMAQRLQGRAGYPQFYPFQPTVHWDKMSDPFSILHKPRQRIFVCSMGELFSPDVDDHWVEAVLATVREVRKHTFIFLTKNPHLLPRWNPWPKNAWVGATATDQQTALNALFEFRNVDAKVMFLSLEPLLGRINKVIWDGACDWLIIGAQTGPGARDHQPKREWVEELVAAADQAGVPVFEKNNLAPILLRTLRQEVP